MPERLSSRRPGSRDARRYLKRAALFGAGLALLWIALQLVPSSSPPREPSVYSDATGTVAASPRTEPARSAPGIFSAGNLVALLILGGGVVFAVYLRRRSRSGAVATPITSLGELSVGQNQSLRLVECGDEILLLGVASGQINLLRAYPTEQFAELRETIDIAHSGAQGTSAFQGTHFSDVLRHFSGRYVNTQQNGTRS